MDITFLFKIAGIGLIVAVLQQMLSKTGREEFKHEQKHLGQFLIKLFF